jgi:hypothetical protein
MATRKQVAANRRNAQRSTGPKTPEGKAAVRLNALKHGLCAEDAVVFGEDEEAFDDLRDSFLDHLQPVGPLEAALVRQIVTAQWRLARCRKLETGFFELGLIDHKDDLELDYNGLTSKDKLAHVFRRDACPTPSVLGALSRYEVRIERAFFRALHELQGLQAARQHPDPPPPAETNFAEQSHSAPDTQPNPVPQNDLTPTANLPLDPAVPPAHDVLPPLTIGVPLAADRTRPSTPGACC